MKPKQDHRVKLTPRDQSTCPEEQKCFEEAELGTKQHGAGSPVWGVATLIYLLVLALTSGFTRPLNAQLFVFLFVELGN